MNAARREIVAELRNQGLTGKEAYEASKNPEFMEKWIRVSIKDQRIDGEPKARKPQSWRARLRFLKKVQLIALKKEKAKNDKVVRRGRRIQAMLQRGVPLTTALRIDRKRND